MNAADTTMVKRDDRLAATGVRRLTPDTTKMFEGTFSLLHCAVQGEDLYRGVFAVLMFPIRHPDHFVSLRYTDSADKDKEKEIGVIENLNDFPKEAQELIRSSLAKHYHEKIVTRVHRIEYKQGLLFIKADIAPDGEDQEFVMYWSYNSAEEYGETGKVLIDVYENRLIIPNVGALPAADRREFQSYIYW